MDTSIQYRTVQLISFKNAPKTVVTDVWIQSHFVRIVFTGQKPPDQKHSGLSEDVNLGAENVSCIVSAIVRQVVSKQNNETLLTKQQQQKALKKLYSKVLHNKYHQRGAQNGDPRSTDVTIFVMRSHSRHNPE